MGKIDGYDFRGLPKEVADFRDQVSELWNYGKYQSQVTTSPPTWIGHKGEGVLTFAGTTGVFYICTTDNASTWKLAFSFTL